MSTTEKINTRSSSVPVLKPPNTRSVAAAALPKRTTAEQVQYEQRMELRRLKREAKEAKDAKKAASSPDLYDLLEEVSTEHVVYLPVVLPTDVQASVDESRASPDNVYTFLDETDGAPGTDLGDSVQSVHSVPVAVDDVAVREVREETTAESIDASETGKPVRSLIPVLAKRLSFPCGEAKNRTTIPTSAFNRIGEMATDLPATSPVTVPMDEEDDDDDVVVIPDVPEVKEPVAVVSRCSSGNRRHPDGSDASDDSDTDEWVSMEDEDEEVVPSSDAEADEDTSGCPSLSTPSPNTQPPDSPGRGALSPTSARSLPDCQESYSSFYASNMILCPKAGTVASSSSTPQSSDKLLVDTATPHVVPPLFRAVVVDSESDDDMPPLVSVERADVIRVDSSPEPDPPTPSVVKAKHSFSRKNMKATKAMKARRKSPSPPRTNSAGKSVAPKNKRTILIERWAEVIKAIGAIVKAFKEARVYDWGCAYVSSDSLPAHDVVQSLAGYLLPRGGSFQGIKPKFNEDVVKLIIDLLLFIENVNDELDSLPCWMADLQDGLVKLEKVGCEFLGIVSADVDSHPLVKLPPITFKEECGVTCPYYTIDNGVAVVGHDVSPLTIRAFYTYITLLLLNMFHIQWYRPSLDDSHAIDILPSNKEIRRLQTLAQVFMGKGPGVISSVRVFEIEAIFGGFVSCVAHNERKTVLAMKEHYRLSGTTDVCPETARYAEQIFNMRKFIDMYRVWMYNMFFAQLLCLTPDDHFHAIPTLGDVPVIVLSNMVNVIMCTDWCICRHPGDDGMYSRVFGELAKFKAALSKGDHGDRPLSEMALNLVNSLHACIRRLISNLSIRGQKDRHPVVQDMVNVILALKTAFNLPIHGPNVTAPGLFLNLYSLDGNNLRKTCLDVQVCLTELVFSADHIDPVDDKLAHLCRRPLEDRCGDVRMDLVNYFDPYRETTCDVTGSLYHPTRLTICLLAFMIEFATRNGKGDSREEKFLESLSLFFLSAGQGHSIRTCRLFAAREWTPERYTSLSHEEHDTNMRVSPTLASTFPPPVLLKVIDNRVSDMMQLLLVLPYTTDRLKQLITDMCDFHMAVGANNLVEDAFNNDAATAKIVDAVCALSRVMDSMITKPGVDQTAPIYSKVTEIGQCCAVLVDSLGLNTGMISGDCRQGRLYPPTSGIVSRADKRRGIEGELLRFLSDYQHIVAHEATSPLVLNALKQLFLVARLVADELISRRNNCDVQGDGEIRVPFVRDNSTGLLCVRGTGPPTDMFILCFVKCIVEAVRMFMCVKGNRECLTILFPNSHKEISFYTMLTKLGALLSYDNYCGLGTEHSDELRAMHRHTYGYLKRFAIEVSGTSDTLASVAEDLATYIRASMFVLRNMTTAETKDYDAKSTIARPLSKTGGPKGTFAIFNTLKVLAKILTCITHATHLDHIGKYNDEFNSDMDNLLKILDDPAHIESMSTVDLDVNGRGSFVEFVSLVKLSGYPSLPKRPLKAKYCSSGPAADSRTDLLDGLLKVIDDTPTPTTTTTTITAPIPTVVTALTLTPTVPTTTTTTTIPTVVTALTLTPTVSTTTNARTRSIPATPLTVRRGKKPKSNPDKSKEQPLSLSKSLPTPIGSAVFICSVHEALKNACNVFDNDEYTNSKWNSDAVDSMRTCRDTIQSFTECSDHGVNRFLRAHKVMQLLPDVHVLPETTKTSLTEIFHACFGGKDSYARYRKANGYFEHLPTPTYTRPTDETRTFVKPHNPPLFEFFPRDMVTGLFPALLRLFGKHASSDTTYSKRIRVACERLNNIVTKFDLLMHFLLPIDVRPLGACEYEFDDYDEVVASFEQLGKNSSAHYLYAQQRSAILDLINTIELTLVRNLAGKNLCTVTSFHRHLRDLRAYIGNAKIDNNNLSHHSIKPVPEVYTHIFDPTVETSVRGMDIVSQTHIYSAEVRKCAADLVELYDWIKTHIMVDNTGIVIGIITAGTFVSNDIPTCQHVLRTRCGAIMKCCAKLISLGMGSDQPQINTIAHACTRYVVQSNNLSPHTPFGRKSDPPKHMFDSLATLYGTKKSTHTLFVYAKQFSAICATGLNCIGDIDDSNVSINLATTPSARQTCAYLSHSIIHLMRAVFKTIFANKLKKFDMDEAITYFAQFLDPIKHNVVCERLGELDPATRDNILEGCNSLGEEGLTGFYQQADALRSLDQQLFFPDGSLVGLGMGYEHPCTQLACFDRAFFEDAARKQHYFDVDCLEKLQVYLGNIKCCGIHHPHSNAVKANTISLPTWKEGSELKDSLLPVVLYRLSTKSKRLIVATMAGLTQEGKAGFIKDLPTVEMLTAFEFHKYGVLINSIKQHIVNTYTAGELLIDYQNAIDYILFLSDNARVPSNVKIGDAANGYAMCLMSDNDIAVVRGLYPEIGKVALDLAASLCWHAANMDYVRVSNEDCLTLHGPMFDAIQARERANTITVSEQLYLNFVLFFSLAQNTYICANNPYTTTGI